ncbi:MULTISPECIES: hypothetical protein [unclassified Rhizobium]
MQQASKYTQSNGAETALTPISTFVSAGDGIHMVAAGSIQPFHVTEGAHEFSTLIFAMDWARWLMTICFSGMTVIISP